MFDLLMVCVEVGFGFDVVLMKVSEELWFCSEVVVSEFDLLLFEMCFGFMKEMVLCNFVLCIGVEDIELFCVMLI